MTVMKIPLAKAKYLEKRIGVRVWDGLLFNRDSITNPMLTVLPNKAGTEIRKLCPQCEPHKHQCKCQLWESSENDNSFCAVCGCPFAAHPKRQ